MEKETVGREVKNFIAFYYFGAAAVDCRKKLRSSLGVHLPLAECIRINYVGKFAAAVMHHRVVLHPPRRRQMLSCF